MHILAGDDLPCGCLLSSRQFRNGRASELSLTTRTVDSVPLIVSTSLEPSLLVIAASLPELRDYVWKHPKPVRYCCDDFLSPRHGLSDADYEYARQQYAAAGSKALVFDLEAREQRMQGSVWESDDDVVVSRLQKKRIPFPRAPFV